MREYYDFGTKNSQRKRSNHPVYTYVRTYIPTCEQSSRGAFLTEQKSGKKQHGPGAVTKIRTRHVRLMISRARDPPRVGQYSARFSRRMKFISRRAALSVITSRRTRLADVAPLPTPSVATVTPYAGALNQPSYHPSSSSPPSSLKY